MTTSPSLVAEGLTLSHGSRVILDGVDLCVRSGRILGLLGPNGAGKTTSIRVIMGFLGPRAGNVRLGERSLTQLPVEARARLGLGYLPQDPSIFPDLSVRDNLDIVLTALGRPRDGVLEVLESMQLVKLSAQKAGSLSGGERRRLEMARLMVLDPEIWLLDEPFTGMDPRSIQRISDVILELRGRGKGVLVSDHNVPQTLGLCDEAVLLDAGRVLVQGTPEEIAGSELARQRYLGDRFDPGGFSRDS